MKVICVGFWKTGTKSLSRALKLLGYKNIYDFDSQYLYLMKLWKKFFDGSVQDSDIYEALKDIDVLIDGPTIFFWSEIYKVFPDAKVILSIRDEDGWWKSFKRMNDKFFEQPLLRMALVLSPTGLHMSNYANTIFKFGLGTEDFRPLSFGWSCNERLCKLRYRMHNCHVLQTVSKEVLLVHRSQDGWAPLCKYLDKEIPTIPYPHQNKNASLFHEDLMKNPLLSKIIKEMIFSVACLVILGGVALYWYYLM